MVLAIRIRSCFSIQVLTCWTRTHRILTRNSVFSSFEWKQVLLLAISPRKAQPWCANFQCIHQLHFTFSLFYQARWIQEAACITFTNETGVCIPCVLFTSLLSYFNQTAVATCSEVRISSPFSHVEAWLHPMCDQEWFITANIRKWPELFWLYDHFLNLTEYCLCLNQTKQWPFNNAAITLFVTQLYFESLLLLLIQHAEIILSL